MVMRDLIPMRSIIDGGRSLLLARYTIPRRDADSLMEAVVDVFHSHSAATLQNFMVRHSSIRMGI
jgi:hypothetical protein